MKRTLALILALVMLFALCACGKKGNFSGSDLKVSDEIPEGKEIPDDAHLKIIVASHASWPYRDDWKVWQYIREEVGGNIEVTGIPSSDFGTKFQVMMASPKDLPDLGAFMSGVPNLASYSEQGAFLALDDYEQYLPDYNKFWDNVSEDEMWMMDMRRSADGKVYYTPIYGMEKEKNIRAWLYRKDIFEKHNLEVPTTTEELYQVAKQLKKLYPKSYPLCMRNGLTNLNVIGSTWKPGFNYTEYYDFENKKWAYGATEDTMLEIVKYFKKMVAEGLVPKDYMTITTASWEELISTDKGFIMPEYQVRIDHFQPTARLTNPDFTLDVMAPPHADNGVGVQMLNKFNYDPTGYAVFNTKREGSIANAFRYINWMYTDEAAELVSWGREGETYKTNADGSREFLLDLSNAGETATTAYGFKSIGAYCRLDPESLKVTVSKEQAATTDFCLEYTYAHINPANYLMLSVDDEEKKAQYKTMIKAFVDENLQKFILGQRPLSEWDDFQKELAKYPVKEYLAIFEKYFANGQ